MFSNNASFALNLNKNYDNMLQLFLRKKIEINWKPKKSGQTGLMVCAQKGNLELMRALLMRGARVNLRDNTGKTVIYHAIDGGNVEVLKELIDGIQTAKASIENSFDRWAQSPCWIRSIKGYRLFFLRSCVVRGKKTVVI